MVDRQELDALLVGALYGELTPADEARLAAHLESHPADRSALEDLKTARTAVRESRVFEDQVEPSQALSAMLLQEAHRRAPRADSEASSEGWLSRFMRMFVVHPAMAAAATLVVVVGVAGTVYLRQGKLDTADPAAERVAMEKSPESASPPAAAAAPMRGAVAAGSAAGSGSAASDPNDSSETTTVDLATTTQGHAQEAPSPTTTAALRRDQDQGADRAAYASKPKAQDEIAFDDFAKEGKAVATKDAKPTAHLATMPAHADSRKNSGYLPVGKKADLPPKEMDENVSLNRDGKGNSNGPVGGDTSSSGGAAGRALAPAATVTVTAPPVAQAAQPPPPPPAATPAPAPAAPVKIAGKQKTEAADKQAPPQPSDVELQGQLKTAVSYARDNRCDDSVKVTNGIRQRAPAFYAQNVADNRDLKGCMVYIKNQDEQIARRRAAKAKASSADEATTPAGPPPANAAPAPTPTQSETKK